MLRKDVLKRRTIHAFLGSLVLLATGCVAMQTGESRRPFGGRATSSQGEESDTQLPPAPIGTVAVGGSGFVTQDLDIPAEGLSLSSALGAMRDRETMQLLIPSQGQIDEAELAIQLIRGNRMISQPVFLAQNTDARGIQLQNGDVINLVIWQDVPLFNPSVYRDTDDEHVITDAMTRPLNRINQIIEAMNEPRVGTIPKLAAKLKASQQELATAPNDVEKQAKVNDLTGQLEDAEKELDDWEKQRKKALALGALKYEITGLFQSPGSYTANPMLTLFHIGPINDALAISRGQAADVIILNRRNGNIAEQFILPFSENIAGVAVPTNLNKRFIKLLQDAHVRDGDVIQYNQLRLHPLVLGGRMIKQARTQFAEQQRQLARAPASERSRRNLTPQDEPGTVSTSLRRMQQRLLRFSLPQMPNLF